MKQRNPRIVQYCCLLLILVTVTLATTLVAAYFISDTGEVKNDFTPSGSIQPTILESFDGNVKSNVYFNVGNTGYPVYVRAAIVITWQAKDGTVYFSKPSQSDYTLDLNLTAWEKNSDGFYYLKDPVESGEDTAYLINRCAQSSTSTAPAEGYYLSVEILVQSVQAIGSTDKENPQGEIPSYQDAWGVVLESQD